MGTGFWSSQRLALEIESRALITEFDSSRIDCAAYTLRLGTEIFVTPDVGDVFDPKKSPKKILARDEQFHIPAGQFAFLLTEESVRVPPDALAFISIKTAFKFKGLINVSGFHVDPGWNGKLIYGVFNAGPRSVVVAQGDQMFLIWYADLDQISEQTYRGSSQFQKDIPSKIVNDMFGDIFSPIALSRKLEHLTQETRQLRADFRAAVWVAGTILTFAIALFFYDAEKNSKTSANKELVGEKALPREQSPLLFAAPATKLLAIEREKSHKEMPADGAGTTKTNPPN